MGNYDVNPDTGEVLEPTDKISKAKVSWGVRLDEETIQELDKVADIIGVQGDKRAVLEHLLKVRATAELKGHTKGKADSIEQVERALDLIRDEMNTLLRHNINKEEEIRDVVAGEMEELEQKIKSLQDKLNNQLEINKELKEENKSLKAAIVDKDKEIQELNERYTDTNKLIARLEKDEAQNQAKLAEFEELKLVHKDLQASAIITEKEFAKAQTELTTIKSELVATKQAIADKEKELKSIVEINTKETENLKSMHQLELNNAVLQKEVELRNNMDTLKEEKQALEKEVSITKESMEKAKIELKNSYEKEIAALKENLVKATLNKEKSIGNKKSKVKPAPAEEVGTEQDNVSLEELIEE